MNRFIYRAWQRDRYGNINTGEALLLACLLHAKGKRNSKDLEDVQKLMHDRNLKK